MSSTEKLSESVYIYRLGHERLYRETDIDVFRSEVVELAQRVPGLRIAVDFSKVEVASSMALGALVGMRKVIKEGNGIMAIFAANEAIEKVLRVMQLDNLFTLFPDEPTAVKELGD